MDKEIEEQINEAMGKAIHYLLYEARAAAGDFPYRLRIDLFFRTEGGTSSHFIERELYLSNDLIDVAENTYQEYSKKEIVRKAIDILRND